MADHPFTLPHPAKPRPRLSRRTLLWLCAAVAVFGFLAGFLVGVSIAV